MHQTIALTIFIELILDKRSGSMTGWLWRRSLPSSSRVSLPIASRTSRESRRHCLPSITITLTSKTLEGLFDLAHWITLCCVIALFKPWPSHSSKYIKQDAISRGQETVPIREVWPRSGHWWKDAVLVGGVLRCHRPQGWSGSPHIMDSDPPDQNNALPQTDGCADVMVQIY